MSVLHVPLSVIPLAATLAGAVPVGPVPLPPDDGAIGASGSASISYGA